MREWYDFPNVKSTKMLSFLFGSRGLRPDLPSPFGRKFLFCLLVIYWGKVKRILYFLELDGLHLKVKAKLCDSRTFADARFDGKH